MAFTQSDIDTLKTAMLSNVKSVTFADGRTVQYRDIAEMKDVLAMAQADVNAASNKSPISYLTVTRGDCP